MRLASIPHSLGAFSLPGGRLQSNHPQNTRGLSQRVHTHPVTLPVPYGVLHRVLRLLQIARSDAWLLLDDAC
jgi:hypothetical protein